MISIRLDKCQVEEVTETKSDMDLDEQDDVSPPLCLSCHDLSIAAGNRSVHG